MALISNSDKIRVFVDFDGTITKEDVGALIFLHFGEPDEINELVRKIDIGEITGNEGWKELFKLLPYVAPNELDALIDVVQIDASFHRFIKFVTEQQIEFWILSDGFDYYIKRIFEKEGIDNIRVFSNMLFYNSIGKIDTVYPFSDEECTDCSNCKRNHILEKSADDDYTIYIGNGSSDRCPAQYCDFIFAKDTLLKFCEKERIPFAPFNSFDDIVAKLNSRLLKKRLKKRHQAELKRKTVYMQG